MQYKCGAKCFLSTLSGHVIFVLKKNVYPEIYTLVRAARIRVFHKTHWIALVLVHLKNRFIFCLARV